MACRFLERKTTSNGKFYIRLLDNDKNSLNVYVDDKIFASFSNIKEFDIIPDERIYFRKDYAHDYYYLNIK